MKPVVLIATPCLTGKVDVNYATSLLQTCGRLGGMGIPHGFDLLVGKKVDMARNLQAQNFLKGEFTHLFFVDDDMGWAPDLLIRLLKLDLDIVAVPARKRMEKEIYNLNHVDTVRRLEGRDDIIEVDYIGTGIILIKRQVFEALTPKVKLCEQLGGTTLVSTFFETSMVPREDGAFREQGEDVFFCKLAIANGFKVYAYLDEDVAHCGDQVYVGNYAKRVGTDDSGRGFLTGDIKEPLRILRQA